jgi:hypothetical protein
MLSRTFTIIAAVHDAMRPIDLNVLLRGRALVVAGAGRFSSGMGCMDLDIMGIVKYLGRPSLYYIASL